MMIEMKMTRYILPLLALVAFAGCTKVERVEAPATKISFQAVNYSTQTKADEVTVLNDFTAFKCLAYLHAEGVDIQKVAPEGSTTPVWTDMGSYQPFFGTAGETISQKENSTEWDPSHTYYWPKGEKSYVNFVAWYGVNKTVTPATTAGGEPTVTETPINPTVAYAQDAQNSDKWTATMTWDFTTSGLPAGANVMYADMAWRYKENYKDEDGNPMYGVSGASEGVPMLFHHALAKVRFQAKADPLTYEETIIEATEGTNGSAGTPAQTVTTSYKVFVSKVELSESITNKAKLVLTNADPGEKKNKDWSVAWTGYDPKVGLSLDSTSSVELSGTATTLSGMETSVMPQIIPADAAVTVWYDVWTYDGSTTTGTPLMKETVKVEDIPLADFSPTINAWAANTIYTYIIIINPVTNVIKFLPDAVAWEDGGTGSLPIE